MAKQQKNQNPATESETSTPPSAKKPALTPEQKRTLFMAYDKADKEVEALEKQVEALEEKRSEAVQRIAEALGKGTYRYEGRVLTIHKRGPTEKRPHAKELYYFREQAEEIQEI